MSYLAKPKLSALLITTALLSVPQTAIAQDASEDEVVTTGVFIPNEKRITSEITSVLDEEIFETTGASDIASALTRVTGLSLSQGKFVIVRGLNERYSFATLNGSPLPSPEPLRRVAPLDLFPTSILSDVVVQKTYSPEFSGEFGGGAIQMSTKAVPNEAFLDISISGSANTETSFKEGLTYGGSDTDWLGYDDGLRDLPELGADGAPLTNFENFDTLIVDQQDEIPGNIGGRVSAGNRYDFDNGTSVGVLGSLGYSNDWQTRNGVARTTAIDAGTLVAEDDFAESSTQNEIGLNGMLAVGVEFDGEHSVQATGLFTRKSNTEARVQQGVNKEQEIVRQDFNEWIEREVIMGQLLGEHYFPDLNDASLTWRASYAEAGRDAPYERRVDYEDRDENGQFTFQSRRIGDNNSVQFSFLDDETFDFGADVVLPIDIADRPVEFKFGGSYLDKTRNSQRYDFRYFGAIPEELRDSRVDVIFSDPVLEAGILEIRNDSSNSTSFPDLTEAGLEVLGAYGAVDVEVNETFRFSAGLRYEDSEQTTTTARSGVADSLVEFPALAEDFLLPAATATFTIDDWQLRLAASKTINRPQFRELLPALFVNTDTDESFVGNPALGNSESINLDARLEYYFGANQFFTIGGFYKDFTNPIEETKIVFGSTVRNSFINAPSAELYGAEIEFEKRWEMAELGLDGDFFQTKDFIIRSNYTYTDSSVSADGEVNVLLQSAADPNLGFTISQIPASGLYSGGRQLQGQSDHLANLQLGIEDYEKGYEATILLNYSSERIRTVENLGRGIPAIIEQLPLSLDFVFNKDFELRGGEYEFGFKVQNILDEPYEATQSFNDTSILVDSYDIGRTFSASLKRKF